jgi:hypothetical protein
MPDASSWKVLGYETDGLSEHPWLLDPVGGDAWLFKPVVVKEGRRQGEDWAEKIASEIGRLLGVPCAEVQLGGHQGRAGSLSRDVKPRRWSLQPGAVLLAGIVDDYESKTKNRAGHSLDNIERALRPYAAPPDAALSPGFSAFDVFAGYLMFDALVANRDRHDHNWAVLSPPPGVDSQDALCGSYDHASSLGFNLGDEERTRRLDEGDVRTWAGRATAYKFEHLGPGRTKTTLVEIARDALGRCHADVREHWLRALDDIPRAAVEDVVARVPGLTLPTATFVTEVVLVNRSRLLDAH